MNLYETLGVKRNAMPSQIKAAFRKRSKDLHPDKGGSDEAFAELSSAYMVLRDKERRKKYDETGETDKVGVDSDLKRMSSALLSLFDAAIREGIGERKDLDVIKLMRKFVKDVMGKKEKEAEEMAAALCSARAMAKRIFPKDKKRNLLGSIMETRERVLESSQAALRHEIRLLKMVLEELENYDCLVEVARTVTMYFTGEISSGTTTA